MHQNIKNFYKDTDTTLNLDLEMEIVGTPDVSVTVNKVPQDLSDAIRYELSLNSDIDICIQLYNKDYNVDSESAIIVKNISVDRYSLINDYLDTVEYTNDHGWTEPTTHIGFNGTWELKIPGPFYISKHHQTGQGWLIYPEDIKENHVTIKI